MSLWTETPYFRLYRSNMLLMTLAVIRNRQHFKELNFVSDTRGIEIAEALGWLDYFNGYSYRLDNLRFIEVKQVWAFGKFVAMLEMDGACAHIDNDAMFIKDPKKKVMDAALFAQSIDNPAYYFGMEMKRALGIARLPAGTAYNAGLIGGSHAAALQRYCRESMAMAKRFYRCEKSVNGTVASMVVEQRHLAYFAERHGIEVGTLIPEKPTQADIEEAGWIHLHGKSKFQPRAIEKVLNRMHLDFPNQLDRFEGGFATLETSPAYEKIIA